MVWLHVRFTLSLLNGKNEGCVHRTELKIRCLFLTRMFLGVFFQEKKFRALLVFPRPIDYVRGVGKGWYEELEGLIEEDIERMIEEEVEGNGENGDTKEKKKKRKMMKKMKKKKTKREEKEKKKRKEKENTFSWYECAGCLCEWFCVM